MTERKKKLLSVEEMDKEIAGLMKRAKPLSEGTMELLEEAGITNIHFSVLMTYWQKGDDGVMKYKRIHSQTDMDGVKVYDDDAELRFELGGCIYLKYVNKRLPHLSLEPVCMGVKKEK